MILCVNEVLPEKFEAINIWSCDLVWFLQPVLQRAKACCLVLIVRLVVLLIPANHIYKEATAMLSRVQGLVRVRHWIGIVKIFL